MNLIELVALAEKCGASTSSFKKGLVIVDVSFMPDELEKFAAEIRKAALREAAEINKAVRHVAFGRDHDGFRAGWLDACDAFDDEIKERIGQ